MSSVDECPKSCQKELKKLLPLFNNTSRTFEEDKKLFDFLERDNKKCRPCVFKPSSTKVEDDNNI